MFLIVPMLYTTLLLRVYQIFIYGDEDNIFKISYLFPFSFYQYIFEDVTDAHGHIFL
ncbi:unnamed protein product [Brassica rapa]|uniref:Uncharacterized protein n=1 Tax=Brassica campestris TaxID=3711 RepID=A0A8D9GHE9_BRACM|nr:unnamed protein product [Brassica rapa]